MNTSTLSTPTAQERDPVCGMNVNPATAKHTHEHAGKKYYFCCAGCADKFKANPAGYLNPPAPKSGLVTLGVPSAMKPSQAAVPSSSSATLSYPSSSSAALSSAALSSRAEPALRDSGTQAQSRDLVSPPAYVCPMCPEVRESKPGPAPSAEWHWNPNPVPPPHRIHLPHASRNCPPAAGLVPHLRDGVRTSDNPRRRRGKFRTP